MPVTCCRKTKERKLPTILTGLFRETEDGKEYAIVPLTDAKK
jgi:hypothetical protein